MKKIKKLPGWAALVLSLALLLLFAGAVLVYVRLGRSPGAAVVRPAVRVEKEQLLEGNDSPTRFASELLPEETIDLNSATVEELQRLDGIGPALAQAIVDYREQNGPFTALEQLLEIPGIGEKRLEKNRDRLRLGAEPAPSPAEEEPLNTLPPP